MSEIENPKDEYAISASAHLPRSFPLSTGKMPRIALDAAPFYLTLEAIRKTEALFLVGGGIEITSSAPHAKPENCTIASRHN